MLRTLSGMVISVRSLQPENEYSLMLDALGYNHICQAGASAKLKRANALNASRENDLRQRRMIAVKERVHADTLNAVRYADACQLRGIDKRIAADLRDTVRNIKCSQAPGGVADQERFTGVIQNAILAGKRAVVRRYIDFRQCRTALEHKLTDRSHAFGNRDAFKISAFAEQTVRYCGKASVWRQRHDTQRPAGFKCADADCSD